MRVVARLGGWRRRLIIANTIWSFGGLGSLRLYRPRSLVREIMVSQGGDLIGTARQLLLLQILQLELPLMHLI